MTKDARMLKILTADAKVLARVDRILTGDELHTQSAIPNVKTCTLAEASRMLRFSRPTIYRLIKKGVLQTVDLNGHPRVLIQSIIDYTNGASVDAMIQGV